MTIVWLSSKKRKGKFESERLLVGLWRDVLPQDLAILKTWQYFLLRWKAVSQYHSITDGAAANMIESDIAYIIQKDMTISKAG